MISNKIQNLVKKIRAIDNHEEFDFQFSNVTFQIERHTQNRYGEEDYKLFMDKEYHDHKLNNDELEFLVSFVIRNLVDDSIVNGTGIMNVIHAFGKCYNLISMSTISKVFDMFLALPERENLDDIIEQLIYSTTGLFNHSENWESILLIYEKIYLSPDLDNSKKIVTERYFQCIEHRPMLVKSRVFPVTNPQSEL